MTQPVDTVLAVNGQLSTQLTGTFPLKPGLWTTRPCKYLPRLRMIRQLIDSYLKKTIVEFLPDHSTFEHHFGNFLLLSIVILQAHALLDED